MTLQYFCSRFILSPQILRTMFRLKKFVPWPMPPNFQTRCSNTFAPLLAFSCLDDSPLIRSSNLLINKPKWPFSNAKMLSILFHNKSPPSIKTESILLFSRSPFVPSSRS